MNPSAAELVEDLRDLAELADSCAGRVWAFREALFGHPYVQADAESLWNAARALARDLRAAASSSDAAALSTAKRDGAELLRVLQGKLGYVLSALDWQSPSFLHSVRPQAGKQLGKITGNENDYKRDMHLDAFDYEAAWRAAYVDAPLRLPPLAHVVSSGMAAMTTLVSVLQHTYRMEGPVLVGQGCYFENRWILGRAFGDRVTLVDEGDADALIATAERVRPGAIFLDTLCNVRGVTLPNLPALLPALARILGPRGFLVLDNSGLATGFQPLAHLPRLGGPRLFVVESLNKFHQFGFDRVTGGVVWTQGGLPTGLIGAREHLGTNMPDASVLALPRPNRALLDRRLARLGRNALRAAERLEAFATRHPNGPLAAVAYPCLPSHPAHAWASAYPFCGAFLTLSFRPGYDRVGFSQALIARIISEAARANVPVIGGSSFGLDVTRVYLTARYATRITDPFLRIAPGTESLDEIDAVLEAIERALS